MGQPKESTGLLSPSPDDPSAYSIYAEEPRGTPDNYKISESAKLSITDKDIDAVTPQSLGQSTPNTVDDAMKAGERLAGGARAPNAEVRQSHEV
jgi:hypothetical protein